MCDDPREHTLQNILSSKHYPQVLRVTRPFYVKGHEYLKQGQIITLLDRKEVEFITGKDEEGKYFKLRTDRSVQVEVIENERSVYTLSQVVDATEHIEAIEFAKELRHDKETFVMGEKFKIEKIGKTFRGRSKNMALRREKDNKVYRFPLDVIGEFKILRGNTVLPFSKILSLKTLPLTVKFRNTPTSSNFPSGIVKIENNCLCDIIYILTVSNDTYVYEAMSFDSNIYVEKCNLTIPKPFVDILPNGVYVNSSEYTEPIRTRYKKKMKEIDTRLTEDIFCTGYYGSATIEKLSSDDVHLLIKERSISQTKSLDEKTLETQISSANENEVVYGEDGRPEPFPRYSKKSKYRNTIQFPAITENMDSPNFVPVDFYRKPEEKSVKVTDEKSTIEMKVTTPDDDPPEKAGRQMSINSISSKKSSVSSNRSFASNDSVSSKIFYSPEDSPKSRIKANSSTRNDVRDVFQHYEPSFGPSVPYRHSRSSSIATEDSGDSGVAMSFNPGTRYEYIPNDNMKQWKEPNSNQISHGYQNVHEVKVDINIDESYSYKSEHNYDDINDIFHSKGHYENNSLVSMKRQEQPYDISRSDGHRLSLPISCDPKRRNEPKKRLEEILSMTQEQVSLLLQYLKLEKYINVFAKELINGKLLRELSEETLIKDLHMSLFEARKLYSYVHGWRPVFSDINGNDLPIKTSSPLRWSVETLALELQNINLRELADFCKFHLVDGALMKSLVENNVISSLKLQHGLSLSGIEMSRLSAFILRDWRPDKNVNTDSSQYHMGSNFDDKILNDKKERKQQSIWNKIVL